MKWVRASRIDERIARPSSTVRYVRVSIAREKAWQYLRPYSTKTLRRSSMITAKFVQQDILVATLEDLSELRTYS